MSPEAQRIAIAQACGFRWFVWFHNELSILISLGGEKARYTEHPGTRFLALWDEEHAHPPFSTQCHGEEDFGLPIDDHGMKFVPDYLNDLNAMHEAEKTLTSQERADYADHLFHICDPVVQVGLTVDGDPDLVVEAFRTVHLTSSQRAEAFLKTKGKYTLQP